MVGMNVNIGTGAKVKRRNRNGGRVEVIVVTAAGVRSYIGDQFITRAVCASTSLHNSSIRLQFPRRITAGGGSNGAKKQRANIGYETWQGPWGTRNVKHGFIFEGIAAHHI